MQQHILFFDIDGTLIHVPEGCKKPSLYLKRAIEQLQKNGHLCFISTGRTFAYLNQDLLDLNFDGYITCNGAVVLKNDQVILSHFFSKDFVKEIIGYFEENDQPYTLCCEKMAYAPERFTEIFKVFKEFGVPENNVSTKINLDQINVAKFEVTAKNDKIASYILDLRNKGFQVVEYGNGNVFEFNMPNVTKGKTIIKLLELLNIPIENSIAFGDGNNDVEMLKIVGRGVAMGNASESAKKAADVITESCADEGIVKELQRLGLISRII